MRIKGIEIEDFVNYKKCSLFIAIGDCDWKCCIEGGFDKSICQNQPLARQPEKIIDDETIIKLFINNPLTEAIVIGGLEPFTRYNELISFIEKFRKKSTSEIIIYTGYKEEELKNEISNLSEFENIIVKFGRFELGHRKHYDEILGIELASDNQYAVKIS